MLKLHLSGFKKALKIFFWIIQVPFQKLLLHSLLSRGDWVGRNFELFEFVGHVGASGRASYYVLRVLSSNLSGLHTLDSFLIKSTLYLRKLLPIVSSTSRKYTKLNSHRCYWTKFTPIQISALWDVCGLKNEFLKNH